VDRLVCFASAWLNLAAAPSILGGTDITGFYTASGYAPFVGQAAMLIWFLVASVSMIAQRDVRATPRCLRLQAHARKIDARI